MDARVPPNAADVAALVEQRVKALDGQLTETTTIEWRGQPKTIPVIAMPINLLVYNPGTHRIRAQRSLDDERDRQLETDPFSDLAQTYVHELLMADPTDPRRVDADFEALKDDLRQHGQKEPGIVTRSGVLINGNTRRAALKELGRSDIRVGVVPPDAGLDDINSIELSLQLRREYKRDYSFMNFLLALEEQANAGRLPADICRDFRIKQQTYERSGWILQLIREVIARSTTMTPNGHVAALRLVDFETHQGKLEELHRTYSTLKRKDPVAAEAMCEQRLLALVLDKSKTDLRLIEGDFYDKYLDRRLAPELKVSDQQDSTYNSEATIPGTGVVAPKPDPQVEALRELADRVLRAQAIVRSDVSASVGPAALTAAVDIVNSTRDSVDDALTAAGKTSLLRRRRFAPVDRLSDANEDLELCLDAVADARATGNFQAEDLDDELIKLQKNVTRLGQLLARSGESTGDGVSWVIAQSPSRPE